MLSVLWIAFYELVVMSWTGMWMHMCAICVHIKCQTVLMVNHEVLGKALCQSNKTNMMKLYLLIGNSVE